MLVSLTTTCTPPFASPRHQVASEECSVLRPVSFPHHGKINEKGKGENMVWFWGFVGLLLVRSGSGVAFFRVRKVGPVACAEQVYRHSFRSVLFFSKMKEMRKSLSQR